MKGSVLGFCFNRLEKFMNNLIFEISPVKELKAICIFAFCQICIKQPVKKGGCLIKVTTTAGYTVFAVTVDALVAMLFAVGCISNHACSHGKTEHTLPVSSLSIINLF